MIFPFLQYINPTWYFNISTQNDSIPYFIDYEKSSELIRSIVSFDTNYSKHEVSLLDAAFQAWHLGVIEQDFKLKLNVSNIQTSREDNYYFVRKYFHPLWSLYILIVRLLSLHSPIQELKAFIKTQSYKRVNLHETSYPHAANYEKFSSKEIDQSPKISVVIPTLNRYSYLRDVLLDLERQDYPNFDVIIVDQSEPFNPEFYEEFKLSIKLFRQEEKALWLARNTAIKESDSQFLLLFDDDSRVKQDWIRQHLKTLDFFQADISSGVSISKVGDKPPANYRFFHWGDQLDTGNALIRKSVFQQVGLFDRQFEKQRMGDGEFGLRAYLAGLKNISNPYADRLHLKVSTGGLRQLGHWDAFRPKKLLAPRPIPSVLYFFRSYYGNKLAFFAILKNVLPSLVPYQFKGNRILTIIGSLISCFLLPIIAVSVWRSWYLASKKIKSGPIIESLD